MVFIMHDEDKPSKEKTGNGMNVSEACKSKGKDSQEVGCDQ